MTSAWSVPFTVISPVVTSTNATGVASRCRRVSRLSNALLFLFELEFEFEFDITAALLLTHGTTATDGPDNGKGRRMRQPCDLCRPYRRGGGGAEEDWGFWIADRGWGTEGRARSRCRSIQNPHSKIENQSGPTAGNSGHPANSSTNATTSATTASI